MLKLCSLHKLVIITKRGMDNVKHLQVKFSEMKKEYANSNFKKVYSHVNLEWEILWETQVEVVELTPWKH